MSLASMVRKFVLAITLKPTLSPDRMRGEKGEGSLWTFDNRFLNFFWQLVHVFKSEPPPPKMRFKERPALTPALSPQERVKHAKCPWSFHTPWCGIASLGLTSAATGTKIQRHAIQ